MHRTFKQDCNATIKFKLSCDKQWLEVTEMNLTHNHETDQRAFHNLPQQRRLDNNVRKLKPSCAHMVLFTCIELMCSIVYSVCL